VQDLGEYVDIGARQRLCEEVAGDEVKALPRAPPRRRLQTVEQSAMKMRIGGEEPAQRLAGAAADIDDMLDGTHSY
jgi:hypothetical protein